VCAKDFSCATLYRVSSVFGTTHAIYVQKASLDETFMCVPNFLVCAHHTTCVTRRHTQLRGNIGGECLAKVFLSKLVECAESWTCN